MCGVPHHSVDHHVAKLVAAGRKVAICDQVEDARAAKGLVRRDITRVVTPGTVLDPESLLPDAPCYLAALARGRAGLGSGLPRSVHGPLPRGARPGRSDRRCARALPAPRDPGRGRRRRSGLSGGRVAAGRGLVGRGGPPGRREPSPAGPAGRGRGALLRAPDAPGRPPRTSGPRCPSRFGQRMGLDAAAIATLELFESSDGSHVAEPLRDPRSDAHAARRSGAARDAVRTPRADPVELAARWDAVEELVNRRRRGGTPPGRARAASGTSSGASRGWPSAPRGRARSRPSARG